ncbi:MAG: hypothetical protein MZW92_75410 [Comamonadaceae bacterium]|nr:hypothetical protein [Comamonadaceae bacterium]
MSYLTRLKNSSKHLQPNLKEYYYAADPDGGARRGYFMRLISQGWEEIKENCKGEISKFKTKNKLYNDASKLYLRL